MKKELLMVAALENGTVIDHIPPEHLFEVVSILGLENSHNSITIGYNLTSNKLGKKGIIKVADQYFHKEEIDRIALLAPNVVLSMIRNYVVCEKICVELPKELVGIARCPNPKCITNNEPMTTHFKVVNKEDGMVKCLYCERVFEKENLIIR